MIMNEKTVPLQAIYHKQEHNSLNPDREREEKKKGSEPCFKNVKLYKTR